MKTSEVLNSLQFSHTIRRLCYQLIENHNDFSNSAIIGLQPNGIYVANRLQKELSTICKKEILTGSLDITFYRDDFRRKETPLIPSVTNLDFSIENKMVVLVDDVIFTGRTVRAALEALQAWGRPKRVMLLVMVDRGHRELPIQPDFYGRKVPTRRTETIELRLRDIDEEEGVYLRQSFE